MGRPFPYHRFIHYPEPIMASWGCPHEIAGTCTKVNHLPCDPGMKGCVLAGRYFFAGNEEKNKRLREKLARLAGESTAHDEKKD